MEANQFLGLIKFYRNEEFLDKLISGCFHCTPPEVYRLDKQEGVSDKFESCVYSNRTERGDEPINIKINDFVISDALGITAHNRTDKDSWMHCWFTLRLPKDQDALESLKSDVEKMKTEFGRYYAFLPAPNLRSLVERLRKLSPKPMYCSDVKYSNSRYEWGNLCKAIEYSYQKEYRFLFGECSTWETDFFVFNDPNGFSDLISKNSEIQLQSPDRSITWFDLSKPSRVRTAYLFGA